MAADVRRPGYSAAMPTSQSGQSRRMGEDKARLDLGGTPLFAQVLARLAPQVGRVVVNRHDAASPLDIKGLPLVTDAPGDHRGPLAGILAALGWARANGIGWIATVAVDTPFFPRDLVRRLIAAVDGNEIAVAGSGGRSPAPATSCAACRDSSRRRARSGRAR